VAGFCEHGIEFPSLTIAANSWPACRLSAFEVVICLDLLFKETSKHVAGKQRMYVILTREKFFS
jgi:hypothetical protein